MTQKFNVRRTSCPQIYAATVTRLAAMIARPNPRFATLTVNLLLTPLRLKRWQFSKYSHASLGFYLVLQRDNVELFREMTNLKMLSEITKSSLSPSLGELNISTLWYFGALTVRCSFNPITTQKMAIFFKYCQTLVIHSFQLVLCCLSLKQHFRAPTVKSSLNAITIQKMVSLDNAVQCVQIIVFSYSHCVYHPSDIFELSRWNFHWTSLPIKRWPIWKILSHASESSFQVRLMLLIITATF